MVIETHKTWPEEIVLTKIADTLNDKGYIVEAEKPASKWIDVDFVNVKSTIIDFLSKL